MKKIILFILMICCVSPEDSFPKGTFGFQLGWNLSTYKGDATLNPNSEIKSIDENYKPNDISFKSGINLGLYATVPIGKKVHFQYGLNISQYGANYKVNKQEITENINEIIQFPALLKFFIFQLDQDRISFYLGPYFGLCTSNSNKDINGWDHSVLDGKGHGDLGLFLGGCYDIKLGRNYLEGDFRIIYGISKLGNYNLSNFGISFIVGYVII